MKKILSYMLMWGFAGMLLLVSCAKEEESGAKNEHVGKKKFVESATGGRKEVVPGDADFYAELARINTENGDIDKAIVHYSRAIEIQHGKKISNNAFLYLNRSRLWIEKEEYSKAIDDANQAFRLDEEKSTDGHYLMGRAFYGMGNYDESVKSYGKYFDVLGEVENAFIYIYSGDAFARKGDFDKALEFYNKSFNTYKEIAYLFAMNPHYLAHIRIGKAFEEKGDLKKAIESYNRAISMESESPNAFEARSNAWKKIGREDKAEEDLAAAAQRYNAYGLRISENDPWYDAHFHSFQFLNQQYHFGRAIKMNPQYAEAYKNMGVSLAAEGEHHDAIANYKKAIEINSQFAEAYFHKGRSLAAQGKHGEAIENFEKAIEIKSKFAKAYNGKGLSLAAQGEHDGALLDFQKAIEMNSNYAEAYNNKGVSLVAKGEHEKAIENLNMALQIDFENGLFYFNRGIAYEKLGETEKSKGNHDMASRLYTEKSLELIRQGKYYEAIENFTKAIESNPKNKEAYANRGFLLYRKGEYENSISDLTNVLELDPDDASALLNRGRAFYEVDTFDKAIADFNKAMEIAPKDEGVYYRRGLAWEKQMQREKAQSDFDKAVEICRSKASSLANEGEFHEAIYLLRKASKINPSNAENYYEIARLGLKGGFNRNSAFYNFNKAADLYLKNGLTKFESKDYEGAVESYRSAAEAVRPLLMHGGEIDVVFAIKTYRDYVDFVRTFILGKTEIQSGEVSNGLQAMSSSLSGEEKTYLSEVLEKMEDNSFQELTKDLLAASSTGDLDSVRDLLENGAEINRKHDYENLGDMTALMVASLEGEKDVVKYLLGKGADVHVKIDKPDGGAVKEFVQGSFFGLFQVVTSNQCSPSLSLRSPVVCRTVEIEKSSMYVTTNSGVGDYGDDQDSAGISYLSLNEYSGNTALGFAVLAGNIDITAMLLKAGADVNVENERGVTPLIISATKGYLDLTKFLVGNGANIDAKSKGIIPSGFYPQAPFLEKIQEKFGISAFAGACFSGYSDVAEYILEEHPQAAKRDGSLALQGAILGGHIDIVRWLLENKITPESVALPGHLLTSASANGYLGIVELLIDSGMNVNDTSSIKSHTPLTAASHLGHIEIVELLLSRGANKHLQTLGGITAYMLAKSEGHKKIMALLEDKAVEIPPLRAEDFELLDPACEGETECNGTYLEEKLVEYLDGGERREVPVVDVNEKSIPEMSVSRTGIVTDGISRLVLRVKTKQDVKFVLVPPGDSDRSSEYPWGALSEYNRDRQHPHSIEISHKEGEYTYGLYRAPANFPLKSLKKPVYITIKAIAKSTGEEIEKKIQLLPPPVVLVHGVWDGPNTWDKRYKDGLLDKGFSPIIVNHQDSGTKLAAGDFDPYSYKNTRPILDLLLKLNNSFEAERRKGTAISQVDVVAHSMGGLVARACVKSWYKDMPFYSSENYEKGYFHKIITMGTPHHGTPIANSLISSKCETATICKCEYSGPFGFVWGECPDADEAIECVVGTLERFMSMEMSPGFKLKAVAVMGDPVGQFSQIFRRPLGPAIYGFQEGSNAIHNIGETKVASHAIVTTASPLSMYSMQFKKILNSNLKEFSVGTINSILGEDNMHDLVVPVKSQKGGLIGNQFTLLKGIFHSEQTQSIEIFNRVCDLLFAETESELFGHFGAYEKDMEGVWEYHEDKDRCSNGENLN